MSFRSGNLRLNAIHGSFRYAACEMPDPLCTIQRVLASPSKRFTSPSFRFPQASGVMLIAAQDSPYWFGRRDHAFIMRRVQTGMRVLRYGAKREASSAGTRPLCAGHSAKADKESLYAVCLSQASLVLSVFRAVAEQWTPAVPNDQA